MNRRPFPATVLFLALFLTGCGTTDGSFPGEPAAVKNPRVVSQGVEQTQAVPAAETGVPPAFATGSNASPAGRHSAREGRSHPRLRRSMTAEWPSAFGPLTTSLPDSGRNSLSPFEAPPTFYPIRAPATLSSFIGLVDDNNVIPPDTMGAAGPTHLVSFLNSEVGFFLKTGPPPVYRTTLKGFWSPLITGNGLPNSPFDPKVLYDPGSGRFIAATLDGQPGNSWVLVAVSKSSDPTTGWNMWAIEADATGSSFADYTGLGIDPNNVYVTANMFTSSDGFQRSKVWRIPKPQLLQTPQVSTITWTEFTTSGSTFTLQPAHAFGAAPAGYLLTEGNGPNTLEVFAVTGSPPSLVSLGTVAVDSYPAVNTLPLAPKTDIDTGDTRIVSVVYRNGHLYGTHTVSNATNSRTEAAWYEIAPSSPPTLVQQGRVSDPARFYYYPSIAVNGNGDVALGFSGSSPTEFAGAYYTARRSSDPPGSTQQVGLLKAGEDNYFKTYSGPDNRWGDYSATVVEPTDDLAMATGPFQVQISWTPRSMNETFWTLQEFAMPMAATPTNKGQWGTWWGSFKASSLGTPGNPITGFRVVRKKGASGTYGVISADLPDWTTSYTDNSVLPADTYFYRVQAFSATDNAYSSELSVTTPSEVAAPENLAAALLGNLTVQLSWNDRANNETGYVIERRKGGTGVYAAIASLPADNTAYNDTTVLDSGATYHYRVGAVGPYSTAYSAEASVTTPSPPDTGGGGGGGGGGGNGNGEGGGVPPGGGGGGGGGGGCLSVAGTSPAGDHLTEAASIGFLLSPLAGIPSRKLYRLWRRQTPVGRQCFLQDPERVLPRQFEEVCDLGKDVRDPRVLPVGSVHRCGKYLVLLVTALLLHHQAG